MYDKWWWPASDLEKYWQGLYGADLETYFFSFYTLKFIREPISVPTCRGITASPALLYQHTPRLPSGCMTLFELMCCIRSFSKKNEKSHPECVKKKGCCQDQSEVSSHRGEEATQCCPDKRTRKRVGSYFSFPKIIPPFSVRLLVTSLCALSECAAPSFPGSLICRWALRSAPRRSQRHSPTPPITRCRKTPHTHLKKHSLALWIKQTHC